MTLSMLRLWRVRALLGTFEEARYLATLPGVWPITVAARIAEIGPFSRYRHGRQLVKLADRGIWCPQVVRATVRCLRRELLRYAETGSGVPTALGHEPKREWIFLTTSRFSTIGSDVIRCLVTGVRPSMDPCYPT